MKKTDLAYIAGIIDGEGCLGIRRVRNKNSTAGYHPYAHVGMTNDYLPQWLHFTFGGGIHRRKQRKTWKETTVWQIEGEGVYAFVEAIYPYLIIKKPQANIILKLKTLKPAKWKESNPFDRVLQEIQYSQVRQLNRRGKSDTEVTNG